MKSAWQVGKEKTGVAWLAVRCDILSKDQSPQLMVGRSLRKGKSTPLKDFCNEHHENSAHTHTHTHTHTQTNKYAHTCHELFTQTQNNRRKSWDKVSIFLLLFVLESNAFTHKLVRKRGKPSGSPLIPNGALFFSPPRQISYNKREGKSKTSFHPKCSLIFGAQLPFTDSHNKTGEKNRGRQ